MKHPTTLDAYECSLTDLAQELGDLRYDALQTFLLALSQKIKSDGEKDTARGRKQLGAALQQTADALADAAEHTGKAWRICMPYMENDFE